MFSPLRTRQTLTIASSLPMNSSMTLSKTRMSNSRGTQIPSPRDTIKLPHRRDWQRDQMPRGYGVYHLALVQACFGCL